MQSIALWLLIFFSGIIVTVDARLNQTTLAKQDNHNNFSIDEVSVLNREFLNFLLLFDGSTVESSEDQRCAKTLQQLSTAYKNRERHGLEWFDSWGKVPSGLYDGNGFAWGNFEQCRRFSWQEVRGQHCTFSATFPNKELPLFQTGLCVPHFCEYDFVLQLYGSYLQTKGVTVVPMPNSCSRDREVEFNGAVVIAIMIFSVFAGLVLGSTTYEAVQLYRKQRPAELYASFSLYKNVRSILQLVPRNEDPKKRREFIDCANGIRVLSMLWIIVVHVHFQTTSSPFSNPYKSLEYIVSFPSILMYFTGQLAVDTFLTLGGMLVAWNLLRELDKKGKINPLMLYLKRYIRLTAPMAPIVLLVVSFAKYMGEGPHWNQEMGSTVDTCIANWWSNLLYVHNYVHTNILNTSCLVWTWYLAVDMQLFIIGPALIYPLWRWGKPALIGIISLAILSIGYVLTIFLINDFRVYLVNGIDSHRIDLTYFPTHARMSVWLLGVVLGYILHRTKFTGVHLSKQCYSTGWAICFALLAVIVYASKELYTVYRPDSSGIADAFYEALSRPIFGMCVMWIIFACVNGYGGIIDRFLSSELWQPLARLSYTMYLLHMLLMSMASVANVKTDVQFSVPDLFYRIWGGIGLTTSVSLLWSAVFEVPFLTLEKLLLRS